MAGPHELDLILGAGEYGGVGLGYQAPPPATASSGSVTPEMFAAWMKTQGYGKQDDPSPLQMLRGQQDPRAAAAAQMYGGGAGNISFAGKPGLIPPDIAQLIDIGAKIAPFV